MILFLIPCNKYAKDGDYMLGRTWKFFKRLVDNNFTNYKIAAVDSIVTFENVPDRELGAIVLYPEEMYRVKGHDVKPTWKKFMEDNFKPLYKHANFVLKGLIRLKNKFEKIAVMLNVRAYKLATYYALKQIYGSFENIYFIDVPPSPAYFISGSTFLIDIMSKGREGGIFMKKQWYNRLTREWSLDVPFEFRYWEHESIISL